MQKLYPKYYNLINLKPKDQRSSDFISYNLLPEHTPNTPLWQDMDKMHQYTIRTCNDIVNQSSQ